jgi:phytoene synthase
VSEHPLQLRAAYSVCRHIARSAARNFYYGFLALPAPKRNALSAVYAFMRRADDISDDPAIPPEQRREKMNDWMNSFRRVVEGERTDDAVLFALADSQKRYNIPLEWLEKLVQGTCMDVPPQQIQEQDTSGAKANAVPQVRDHGLGANLGEPRLQYETFAQLYDYCYHVASVVGLVCIRIFGYRDPHAEKLAEETGVAFQLTNILRDVKEDAGLGRVYLPREDFARFGIDPRVLTNGVSTPKEQKTGLAGGAGSAPASLRQLMEFEALRARAYYRAAEDLIPLVNEDSQAALWTMVEIYRRLLEKIVARNYDVFSQRVALSPAEKLTVMIKGWLRFR